MERLPSPNDFEPLGSSYMSGGINQGYLRPSRPVGEQQAEFGVCDVFGLKQRIIRQRFRLTGLDRPANVLIADGRPSTIPYRPAACLNGSWFAPAVPRLGFCRPGAGLPRKRVISPSPLGRVAARTLSPAGDLFLRYEIDLVSSALALLSPWSFDTLSSIQPKSFALMTISSGPTLYDDIPYPGGVFPSTHPEHLATLATLYGMKPAEVGRCRVLELGCGFGANLLPMAYHYPDAKFVGIDLSGSSVARGRQNTAALGLRNMELHHLDILDVGPQFGEFDYIISHGVYSWVPDIVRDKMLRIFKANLAPQGVCYISYNAYPFSHTRDLVRDLALFHTRHLSDPREKVAQARAILRFVSDAARADTTHGAILREQNERISKMADEFFFHDDLNEIAQAFLLYQVAERAQQHGLQYLSDADFARGNVERYPDGVRAVLESFPDNEFIARNQYQDFIDGFGFRRTLLCHDEVTLQRSIPLKFFQRCHFTSAGTLVEQKVDAGAQSELLLGTRDESVFGISHWLARAAYLLLSKAWPRAVSFDDLMNVRPLDGDAEQASREKVDEEILAEVMYKLACSDAVSFSLYPRCHLKGASDKLFASSLARKQSEVGCVVVNLLHQSVRLENSGACQILQLLDGTRDFDLLVADVQARMPRTHSVPIDANDQPHVDSIRASIRNFLQQARKLGLMAN
jgi:SAM-dependent methyltransferase